MTNIRDVVDVTVTEAKAAKCIVIENHISCYVYPITRKQN